VRGIYSAIEERHLQFNEDFQALNHELRVYGGALFDQLIPSDLQAWLWSNWRKLDHIYVRSDEPFVPWELVHLKKPGSGALPRETRFLGQRGLTRWLLDTDFQPQSNLHIRKKSARYVIPDYANEDDALPNAEAEQKLISDLFDATALPQAQSALYRALGDPDSYDLLHFCCHGTGDSSDIMQARIELAGKCRDVDGKRKCTKEYLSAETVRQTVSVQKSRPLVVMNACQSGTAGYAMSGLAGFAPAFLQGGAGAFIGTHWNVEDSAGLQFAETFYGQLLNGNTVSEAMNAARTDARKYNDASWLAYVAYADPYAKLTID
jgi:hypothetical protein